jgi:hypothetical protein
MSAEAERELVASEDYWPRNRLIKYVKACGRTLNLDLWFSERKIFSFEYAGIELIPFYGLDSENNYQPHEVIGGLIKVFSSYKTGKGIAFWFHAVNGYLGGRIPKELIKCSPLVLMDAAAFEIRSIEHG